MDIYNIYIYIYHSLELVQLCQRQVVPNASSALEKKVIPLERYHTQYLVDNQIEHTSIVPFKQWRLFLQLKPVTSSEWLLPCGYHSIYGVTLFDFTSGISCHNCRHGIAADFLVSFGRCECGDG